MSYRALHRPLLIMNIIVMLFAVLLLPLPAMAGARQAQEEPPSSDEVTPQSTDVAARLYFPYVTLGKTPAYRIGYNVIDADITRYPDINQLDAGWYLNWSVLISPLRPKGIEFVQTIRVHQKLTCPMYSVDAWDRTKCPYEKPYDYVIHPSWTNVAEAVRAMPGALWLIGNEIDRRDWFVDGPNPHTSGQDEILPETYAIAYHDLYSLIKSVDPSARVGVGGVIQATPLRLEYLTKIWDAYSAKYGTPMPVDVWNVHNFILKEKRYYPGCSDCYGADIPPGSDALVGVTYSSDSSHVNMTYFAQQIRDFRQWMKDHGQQNKPLMVSEYGVLYSHAGLDDQGVVENFMLNTFDHFLDTKDCNLGYPQDACRLVQRWAWYSLDDDGYWTNTYFNEYGALFDRDSLKMTNTGKQYRDWVAAHRGELN